MSNAYTVKFPNLKGGFDDIVIKANNEGEFKAKFTEMNRRQNADILSGKVAYQPPEEQTPVISQKDNTSVNQRLKMLEAKVETLTELIVKLVKK